MPRCLTLDASLNMVFQRSPGVTYWQGLGKANRYCKKNLGRYVLNSRQKQLTQEILCTFMAEVTGIVNLPPVIAIDTGSRDPLVLSPNILLTQKQGEAPTILNKF